MSFHAVYGLETVALRYFNIFGPRQSPASEYAAVIPNFMSCALLNEEPVIYGDGEQCRDFTYIENAVQANRLAAEATGAPGNVFNVACGRRTTVTELARAVGDAAGCELVVKHTAPRKGDVRVSVANIDKARHVLAYSPTVDVEEGLRRTWEHFSSDEGVMEKIQQRRRWLAASA
jgi:nucleoside-diphosphate-sugar epimerase